MRIVNKSKVAGGNQSRRAQLKQGQVYFFESFDQAFRFCEEHSISSEEIIAKGTTYKVEV